MMQFVFITFVIVSYCCLFQMIHAIDWQELTATVDGKILVAISRQDGIYLSLDRGNNWIQSNAPTNLPWSSVSMSGDGRVIAATTSKHGIYLSVDSGKTWNQAKGTNSNSEDWKNIRVSVSGKNLIACSDRVLSSEDYGETWKTANFDVVIEDIIGVSVDDSGQHRVVVGEALLTTKDYGESWKVASAPVSDWSDVACSSDGRLCFAASVSKGIFSSSDYGQNWVKTSAPELSWNAIASDPKGEQISAVSADGIYFSANYGATWAAVSSPSGNWISVTMTNGGSSIYALQENSEIIYGSHDRGQSWEKIDNKQVKGHQDVRNHQQESLKDLLRSILPVDEGDEILAMKAANTKEHVDHLLFHSLSAVLLDQSLHPSEQPTDIPSSRPTNKPSSRPTSEPTKRPASQPSTEPSGKPSSRPSSRPSKIPSSRPSSLPSTQPTGFPSAQPSSLPSGIPSSQPSSQPTSQPTAPTFAPTQIPTASPSLLRTPQFMISATFTINGVNGTLTNSSLAAIAQAIYATAIKPCTVKIISWYVVGSRRMLLRVVRDVISEFSTTASYQVNSQILYNLVDFPNDNITYLTTKTQMQIVHGVTNGSFQQSLRAYARANGINELADSTCTNVTTNTESIGVSNPDYYTANLTDSQIAGIVIGSVIGVILLLIIVYYLIVDRRSKLVVIQDGRYDGRYKPNDGRTQDLIVLEDDALPPSYLDETFTLHLEDGVVVENKPQVVTNTDITDGYMRIHL